MRINLKKKRSPIGNVHTNPERIDLVERLKNACRCDSKQCVACDATDEIARLRDKVQDLQMYAQQDACEMERMFINNNDLTAAGDDLADLLTGMAASSRLTRTEEATIDKYLTKWKEARRG